MSDRIEPYAALQRAFNEDQVSPIDYFRALKRMVPMGQAPAQELLMTAKKGFLDGNVPFDKLSDVLTQHEPGLRGVRGHQGSVTDLIAYYALAHIGLNTKQIRITFSTPGRSVSDCRNKDVDLSCLVSREGIELHCRGEFTRDPFDFERCKRHLEEILHRSPISFDGVYTATYYIRPDEALQKLLTYDLKQSREEQER